MKMHYSHSYSARRIEQIVGGFVVLPLIGLLLVAWFMVKAEHMFDQKYLLTAHLTKSYGLEPGAPVLLAGIPIGKVKAVNLNDAGAIDVLLQMLAQYQDKVREDSVVAVERSGVVVGQAHLMVTLGSRGVPALADGATIQAAEPRDLTDLVSEVAPVLQSVQRTLLRVEQITKDVQLTVQTGSQAVATVDRAIAELPQVVSSVHRVVGSIEKTAAVLPAITGSVQQSIAELPALIGSVQRTVGSVEKTAAALPQITTAVERTTAELPAVVASVQRTIGTVERTAQALPEITNTVKSTLKVTESVVKTTASASAALPEIVETTRQAANNIKVTTDAMQDLGREMPAMVRAAGTTFKDLNTIIRGAKKTFPVSTFVKNAGPEPSSMPESGLRSLRGDQLGER